MKEFNFSDITGFDWDKGNFNKNRDKHQVSFGECEEVFFNEPFFTYFDKDHSVSENRYYLLGETNDQRYLFIVFTIRKNKIRIISARNMNKNERNEYENLKKNTENEK